MKLINTGVTRHVILVGSYAVKIPRLNYGYRLFILGLLANHQEHEFSRSGYTNLVCPVLFYLQFGLLSVMPRCKLVTEAEYAGLDLAAFENVPCEKS